MNSNDKTVHLILTEQAAHNLVQALDLAVKAGGLNTAVLCVEIAQIIESQLYPKDSVPVKNQEPVDEKEQKTVPNKQ
jgi:hypothetical protein